MKIYFVRHGETNANARGALPNVDTLLTDEGVAQVENTSKYLCEVGIDKVYSSPFPRAIHTAGIISDNTGAQIQIVNGLQDMDYGNHHWMNQDDRRLRRRNWVSSSDPNARFPYGGNHFDIRNKVEQALIGILWEDIDSVAIVGHKDSNTIALGMMAGFNLEKSLDIEQPNDMFYSIDTKTGSVFHITYGLSRW